MERYRLGELELLFDCAGRDDWGKFSFPVWYGMPVKANWRGYRFDFNLRGGLKRLSGSARVWPEAQDVLKRTDGGDWVYYGAGGYESSYGLIKNYYIPFCDTGATDLFPENPLAGAPVRRALEGFDRLAAEAGRLAREADSGRPREFLARLAARNREGLAREAATLHRIVGARLPVLPPDTIDVDYELIPLLVSEGCRYHCPFCRFRTGSGFRARSREEILAQLRALRAFYGDDLTNYNSLVLGQNDALAAGGELLLFAAESAYEILNLPASFHRGRPNLFLFGSVDSFLALDEPTLDRLEGLPFRTTINVGLESFDQRTLDRLGKPLAAARVQDAFRKLVAVNRSRANVTISGNLVSGGSLPAAHLEGIKETLCREATARDRGALYLSPLAGDSTRREILREFRELKVASPLPLFIYLAQRL